MHRNSPTIGTYTLHMTDSYIQAVIRTDGLHEATTDACRYVCMDRSQVVIYDNRPKIGIGRTSKGEPYVRITVRVESLDDAGTRSVGLPDLRDPQ